MTVPDQNSRMDYIGNGSTDEFAFTFRIFAAADLLVTERDDANTETELVLNTDYTVDGVDDIDGGTITRVSGNLPTGYRLTIRRRMEIVQETDLKNQGAYLAEVVEKQLDRNIMIEQQQQDEISRSLKLPESIDPDSFNATIPVPSSGSQLLATNSTNDGFTLLSATDSVAFVSNPTVDHYDSGSGFTAGTTTSLTLSATPGTKNNTVVTFDGVVQHKDTYSVSGTTITFTSAIPLGTLAVEVAQQQTIAASLVELPDDTDLSSYPVISSGSTTSRSLANRFSTVFDIRDFGALVDGSTDDAPAINAAISACPAGGVIFFPRGVTRIASTISISKTLTFTGQPGRDFFDNSWDGEGSSVIHKTTNGDAIQWNAPNSGNSRIGIHIRDLLIRGGFVSSSTTVGSGLSIDGRQQPGTFVRLILDNAHFCEFPSYGLKIVGAVYGGSGRLISAFNNNLTGVYIEQASGDTIGEMSWDTIRCFDNGAGGATDADRCGLYCLPGSTSNSFRNLSTSENVIGSILRGGSFSVQGFQCESNTGTRQIEIGGGSNGVTSMSIDMLSTSPGSGYTGSHVVVKGNAKNVRIRGWYHGDTLGVGGEDILIESGADNVHVEGLSGSHTFVADDNSGGINFLDNTAFLAVLDSAMVNATGDGTNVTVLFNNEIRDGRSAYIPATGIFTAPMSGLYDFSAAASIDGIGVGHDRFNLELVTTSRTLGVSGMNLNTTKDAFSRQGINCSWSRVYLAEGDTAFIRLSVANGGKTVGVQADATKSWFSGGMTRP